MNAVRLRQIRRRNTNSLNLKVRHFAEKNWILKHNVKSQNKGVGIQAFRIRLGETVNVDIWEVYEDWRRWNDSTDSS